LGKVGHLTFFPKEIRDYFLRFINPEGGFLFAVFGIIPGFQKRPPNLGKGFKGLGTIGNSFPLEGYNNPIFTNPWFTQPLLFLGQF